MPITVLTGDVDQWGQVLGRLQQQRRCTAFAANAGSVILTAEERC